MKKILQYKNLILGIVIIFIFGIITRSISSHYSLEKEKLKIQESKLQDNKKITEKWKNLEKEYKELSKKFLNGGVLVFKKSVEEKAQASGVDIISLSISRADKEFYREEIIKMNLEGSYKNFRDFIKSLEEESIEIERLKIVEAERKIKVELDLKGIMVE